MDPYLDYQRNLTRRSLLATLGRGVGSIALGSLLSQENAAAALATSGPGRSGGLPGLPHFPPRAKRVICLFQSGGMSHVDLFDHKDNLVKRHGEELPVSIKGTQRVTGMTSGQRGFPVVAPIRPGKLCGPAGSWISDLLPFHQKIGGDLTFIKSLHTDAINHDPAITWLSTGNQLPGYASIGSWVTYGLGSENENLPAFISMVSQGSGKNPGQPVFSRLWGSGYLPSSYQGVGLRPGANPVLYLKNPDGVSAPQRRAMLDDLARLNTLSEARLGDPETLARIHAYEMAYRMQTSVPELTDISNESAATLESYGPDVRRPGSYAANCLLGRRLLERGVRFVQLYHRGWDQHTGLQSQLPAQCRDIDQPTAALVTDLKNRGLLDDTLVIFATEFGRTTYCQGDIKSPGMGRDHHGRCFSAWLAGGGVVPGLSYGRTDDYCYNIEENPVHLRDLHATLLHQLGIHHDRFSFPHQGLDQRLTGVEKATVVKGILA